MRVKAEVGVQPDTQDFRGSVQRSPCIVDLHLRVELGLVGVRCEQCHTGFLGSNGQLLAIGPPHQYGTRLGLHDAGSRRQQREFVGIERHV